MAYKLLVMDLDGTLTNTQKVITHDDEGADGRTGGGRATGAGLGPPTYGIMPLVKQLDMARHGGFVLSYNGGNIIDCQSGETIFRQELPHNMVEPSTRPPNRAGDLLTYGNNAAILTEDADDPYIAIEAKINNMPIQHVDNFGRPWATHHQMPRHRRAQPSGGGGEGDAAQFGSPAQHLPLGALLLEMVAPGIDKAPSRCNGCWDTCTWPRRRW